MTQMKCCILQLEKFTNSRAILELKILSFLCTLGEMILNSNTVKS